MGADVATLATGSRFEDRYEILEELGAGSFGRVYQARQLSTGKLVALKVLSAREGSESSTGREVERFRRETQIGATLSHPNIVELLDAGGTGEGQLYAVFAYVPGETLEQALAREGAIGVRESVRLMTQVLEALEYAHAKGILHRDLKPSNLMLSGTAPRRHAVVLDFGLGGLAEGRRRREWQTLTQAREFLGTPLYASPEQLSGEAATERSDLYAWGLVFLECLTGSCPFAQVGAAERLLTGGGAVEVPEWLRGHRLGELLERVTARDVAKRAVSSEALLEALDEIARGELPEAPQATPTPAPLGEPGERRHLTVLCCDLVGSSALGQRLEPEAYHRIVQAYHAHAAEAIGRYEGHVAQYLGDGLLVYFGFPQAHEDDAERAVRAGRQILRDLQVLNPRLEAEHGVRLKVRIGIHTGPVVVGETGGGEERQTLAIGDTVNVAARLEGVAEPDTVVISDATLRLVAGLFVTEDRGCPALKGIAHPIRAYRVVQPSGVTSRLDRAPKLTPFVGREQELGLLLDRFAQVQEGQGQAVLLAGEAGIGKSRLVYEMRDRLRKARIPHGWLEGRTSPYTQQSAFRPVIELVEQGLRFEHELAPEAKIERLERGLAHAGLELGETVPLLASLLSLRLPERYAPLEISPQLQRQRTLEALLAWVLALGEKQPLVLAVEDLHWADPSTLEWLRLVIEQCPTTGVLLLFTFRPEFEPPWPAHAHLQPLVLGRLRREAARMLAVAASSGSALPEALLERIAARSDGVPLFVEELTRSVLCGPEPSGGLADLEIPETLQDSLMARLDRLGAGKAVAQLGAAIGRDFSFALLQVVAPIEASALREGLGQLVEAELVYQRGLPPKAVYSFKHALVQQTAYGSLLASQCQELHARIVDALESHFADRVAAEPEEIARHCESAGRTAEAVGYYERAGARAARRFAHSEAVAHFERAIELLRASPETRERNHQELKLLVALAPALIAAKGYTAPEVAEVFTRARSLCRASEAGPELLPALIWLGAFYNNRGEIRTALELSEQALALARRSGEVYPRVVAHTRVGVSLYCLGHFARAHETLDEAIRLYDPEGHRSLASAWGQDWGLIARAYDALALWQLGHPDRARRLSEETVALARKAAPYTLAFATGFAAGIHHLLRDPARARQLAEESLAIASSRGLVQLVGLHFTLARSIPGPQRIDELQRSIAMVEATGSLTFLPSYRVALAESYGALGLVEEGLAAAESACASRGELAHEDSSLLRVRGELLRRRGARPFAAAEGAFREALEVARRQGSKGHELRAATSLARLLRDQCRRDEARALLQPVYDWFTEGFDTADLKDAKALLEELS